MLQKFKWQLGLVGAGIILVGGGIFLSKSAANFGGDKVEILGDSAATAGGELVVEISGAVEKPGVYKMTAGSRINDLLIVAGGLSQSADREAVDKTINRAAKLTDGQKVYIKDLQESPGQGPETAGGGVNEGPININVASQKELESLVGIGPTYATNIVEHRYYSDVNDLVTKKIIPQKTFDKIKDKITVY